MRHTTLPRLLLVISMTFCLPGASNGSCNSDDDEPSNSPPRFWAELTLTPSTLRVARDTSGSITATLDVVGDGRTLKGAEVTAAYALERGPQDVTMLHSGSSTDGQLEIFAGMRAVPDVYRTWVKVDVVSSWDPSWSTTATADLTIEVLPSDVAEPVPAAVRLAAGGQHSLALLEDGTVRAWGDNANGQLGDGTTADRWNPVAVSNLTDVQAIAAGGRAYGSTSAGHSLALLSDGTVMAWGDNTFGQLGDGSKTNRSRPVLVSGVSARAIAAGAGHSLALLLDGTVVAWGGNFYGQLGDGTVDDQPFMVPVAGLTGVQAIAAGSFHSLALLYDGTVMGWGYNLNGQLGNGDYADDAPQPVPVQVANLTSAQSIAAAEQTSFAVLADGSLLAWGDSVAIGDGTTEDRPTPVGPIGSTALLHIGSTLGLHALAVTTDGTVLAWGWNGYGQLGADAGSHAFAPMPISTLPSAQAVAGGGLHSLALQDDDGCAVVWAWGNNESGQLGDGVQSYSTHWDAQSRWRPSIVSGIGEQNCRALMVHVNGDGVVSSDLGVLDCDDTCTDTFPPEQVLTLTATPYTGSLFAGWGGDCSDGGADATVVLLMDKHRNCTATFSPSSAPLTTLTLEIVGDGTVTSDLPGIACNSGCSAEYNQGAVVTLTPKAEAGWAFAGWSGDSDCSDGQVVLDQDVSCIANFTKLSTEPSLTIVNRGPGSGTVTSYPPGIDCNFVGLASTPEPCTAEYSLDTSVWLSPTPDAASSSTFGHWIGCDMAYGIEGCAVSVTGSVTVEVYFEL